MSSFLKAEAPGSLFKDKDKDKHGKHCQQTCNVAEEACVAAVDKSNLLARQAKVLT